MAQPRIRYVILAVTLVAATLVQMGCETKETPSAAIGRITFSRDYEDERRVLRVEPSALQVAECMQSSLPVDTGAPWKETVLDPTLHRRLVELLSDESRIPFYHADTEVAVEVESFICEPRGADSEFCYVPEVVVSSVNTPWRFSLNEEVVVSAQGQELIEEFLRAHDACWNREGLPANGGAPIE